eukprot:m.39141 g.39141  ORF g.39141 m.39141 type:complete len:399 (+) comp32676_c0_seq4:168-1364(+)
MNEICVRTNKSEYVGGETVYGFVHRLLPSRSNCSLRVVYLSVKEPIESKRLKIKVKGYEKCRWEYSYSEQDEDSWIKRTGEKKGRQQFLDFQQKLIEYDEVFPFGYYLYPFQYSLPHGLPGILLPCSVSSSIWVAGVFDYKKNGKGHALLAQVHYKVKAEVDTPGTKYSLKAVQQFTVRDVCHCKGHSIEPIRHTKTGAVKTCCCIPRGNVIVAAKLEKTNYQAGEEALLFVELSNGSSVRIDTFVVKLMRVIRLRGSDPHRENSRKESKCILDTISMDSYKGCDSGASKKTSIPIKLWLQEGNRKERVELQPGTSGAVVKCKYHIDIEIQVPWAPDIEIHVPIQIEPPKNRMWEEWKPPPWANKCKLVSQDGPHAIPTEILQSPAFAGLLMPAVINN